MKNLSSMANSKSSLGVGWDKRDIHHGKSRGGLNSPKRWAALTGRKVSRRHRRGPGRELGIDTWGWAQRHVAWERVRLPWCKHPQHHPPRWRRLHCLSFQAYKTIQTVSRNSFLPGFTPSYRNNGFTPIPSLWCQLQEAGS